MKYRILFFLKLFSICFTYTQHYEYFTTLLNIWVKVGDLKKRQGDYLFTQKMWWKGAHTASYFFFSKGPRVRLIITTTQIPCRTCQPPVNRSCWNIRCLFWVELIFSLQKCGHKIILMTKPIETQNNSYATTDDT